MWCATVCEILSQINYMQVLVSILLFFFLQHTVIIHSNFRFDGLNFLHTSWSSLLDLSKQRWGDRDSLYFDIFSIISVVWIKKKRDFFCFFLQRETSSFQLAAASLSDSLKVKKLKKEKWKSFLLSHAQLQTLPDLYGYYLFWFYRDFFLKASWIWASNTVKHQMYW